MEITFGVIAGYQCRCNWGEDGTAMITLLSLERSLAWAGHLGRNILDEKSFKKKISGEEDLSEKV